MNGLLRFWNLFLAMTLIKRLNEYKILCYPSSLNFINQSDLLTNFLYFNMHSIFMHIQIQILNFLFSVMHILKLQNKNFYMIQYFWKMSALKCFIKIKYLEKIITIIGFIFSCAQVLCIGLFLSRGFRHNHNLN